MGRPIRFVMAGPDRLVCLYSTPKFELVKQLSSIREEN
jgi:hypothetical protein